MLGSYPFGKILEGNLKTSYIFTDADINYSMRG